MQALQSTPYRVEALRHHERREESSEASLAIGAHLLAGLWLTVLLLCSLAALLVHHLQGQLHG